MKRATRAARRSVAGLAGALVVTAGMWILPDPALAAPAPVCGGITHQNDCNSDQVCICCSDDVCYSPIYGDNHGNCVWWAWELACRNWGEALSSCHDAHTWNENNEATHHISPEPCVDTIFVCEQNTSYCQSTNWGHVGWVLAVDVSGAITVSEQGCCWFYGERERTFDAQLASPTMNYIYQQGVSSCTNCECEAGDSEQRPCTGGCGTEVRTCGADDCTWGDWSGCDAVPECEPAQSESCGVCGARICLLDCTWSACNDPCDGDAGTPELDSSVSTPDSSVSDPDGGGDLGASNAGCSCQSDVGGGAGGAGVALLLLLLLLGRRRRARAARAARRRAGCWMAVLVLLGGVGACERGGTQTGTDDAATPGPDALPLDGAVDGSVDGGGDCFSEVFPFTDAEELVVVPDQALYMHVKLWGAGGNAEGLCDYTNNDGLDGGQGGFTEAIFKVHPDTDLAPGTQLVVIVGAAGLAGASASRFGFAVRGGGGLTGIFFGPGPLVATDHQEALAVAGGGGSAGASGCYGGGPGNHTDSGGRGDMQGGAGLDTDQTLGGGAGFEGGAGGDHGLAATGGSGWVDAELTLDQRVYAASQGDSPVPGASDEDYVAQGGTAGRPESAGLAVIKFVCAGAAGP